jgi:hypothetical protein
MDVAYSFFCGVVIAAFVCIFALFPRMLAWPGLFREDLVLTGPRISMGNTSAVPGIDAGTGTEEFVLFREDEPSALLDPWYTQEEASMGQVILDFYRNSETREPVIEFFTGIIQSRELAMVILDNASAFNISPSLAFALCWEESRFKTRAVNRFNTNNSIDRGLFQLNSESFPSMTEQDFFNPQKNVYHGLAHLRWCLDSGGSVVAGLAMYNAGTVRVSSGGTPKRTLDYVASILASEEKIDTLFAEREFRPMEFVLEDPHHAPENEPLAKPRLTLLTPIARF